MEPCPQPPSCPSLPYQPYQDMISPFSLNDQKIPRKFNIWPTLPRFKRNFFQCCQYFQDPSLPQWTHHSYTTTDFLAAAHLPILHHHRCFYFNLLKSCQPTPQYLVIRPYANNYESSNTSQQYPSGSALFNSTPPPMSYLQRTHQSSKPPPIS